MPDEVQVCPHGSLLDHTDEWMKPKSTACSGYSYVCHLAAPPDMSWPDLGVDLDDEVHVAARLRGSDRGVGAHLEGARVHRVLTRHLVGKEHVTTKVACYWLARCQQCTSSTTAWDAKVGQKRCRLQATYHWPPP
jgi:hypothetical protein